MLAYETLPGQVLTPTALDALKYASRHVDNSRAGQTWVMAIENLHRPLDGLLGKATPKGWQVQMVYDPSEPQWRDLTQKLSVSHPWMRLTPELFDLLGPKQKVEPSHLVPNEIQMNDRKVESTHSVPNGVQTPKPVTVPPLQPSEPARFSSRGFSR